MDRISHYRQLIESIFKEYARLFNQQPKGVEVLAVCDETTDTYAIVNVGWDGDERLNTTSVLMRIIGGKIWVEEDRTMYGSLPTARPCWRKRFWTTIPCQWPLAGKMRMAL